MNIIRVEQKDLAEIYHLVQTTIKEIYPQYYPSNVVNFFCEHHKEQKILKDILDGNVYYLSKNNEIVGTISVVENEITRLFVKPQNQHQGFGKMLLKFAEEKIKKNYVNALLDSSLPGVIIYEKAGYHSIRHNKIQVEDSFLVYGIMEKKLL